jgi:hypothetical protein
MSDEPDREKYALKHFLDYQRASVRSIVEGMDEAAWHRSVVPSGWTPAGLVQHLGDAERHWFQQVMTGTEIDLPWDEGRPPYDPDAAFITDRPAAESLDRPAHDRGDGQPQRPSRHRSRAHRRPDRPGPALEVRLSAGSANGHHPRGPASRLRSSSMTAASSRPPGAPSSRPGARSSVHQRPRGCRQILV